MEDYKVVKFSYWKNTRTGRVAIVLNWWYAEGTIRSYEILPYGDRDITSVPYEEFQRRIREKEIIEI